MANPSIPDPLAELRGLSSCLDCGVLVGARRYGEETVLRDVPCTARALIDRHAGPLFDLPQRYGLERPGRHVCPPLVEPKLASERRWLERRAAFLFGPIGIGEGVPLG